MVGQRARGRERVLDGRKFLDFHRHSRAVAAIVQVLAEEVGVVLVVPVGVRPIGLGRFGRLGLGGLRLWVHRLNLLGGHLLEHRILDDFLIQELRELECRHRQELDRLLQRWRQDELLREACLELLGDGHGLGFKTSEVSVEPEIGPEVDALDLLVGRQFAGVPLLKMVPACTMCARSVIFKVSRTLWSVMRTPMPRFFRWKMIFWISETAMGSIPANGSSSRMNFGSFTRARVISTRRRSPPEQRVRLGPRQVRQREFGEQFPASGPTLCSVELQGLENGEHILLDREARGNRRLLRQVRQALPRTYVDRVGGDVHRVQGDRPESGRVKPDAHVERRRLAGAVRTEQTHDLARIGPRGSRRRRRCGRHRTS